MATIQGKWKSGTGGHHIWDFWGDDSCGNFETYTTADRSRSISGSWCFVKSPVNGYRETLLELQADGADRALNGFSLGNNYLKLYPLAGGSPIILERTY